MSGTSGFGFVIGAGAAAVGYLALGITFWQTSHSMLVQALYVLTILVLTLAVQNRKLSRELGTLAEKTRQSVESVEELERTRCLDEGMVAMVNYVAEAPRADQQHRFSYVLEEYVVHGDDGTYNWTLHGANVGETPSTQLIVKVTGDSPLDRNELSISATDEAAGADLDVRTLRDKPYCKVLAIIFPEPLETCHSFTIKFSCGWGNTFLRTRLRDYVFFPWGSYAANGVDRLVGRLVCDSPVSDFVLWRLRDGRRVRAREQPREVDTSANRSVLVWETPYPDAQYLLTFRRDR